MRKHVPLAMLLVVASAMFYLARWTRPPALTHLTLPFHCHPRAARGGHWQCVTLRTETGWSPGLCVHMHAQQTNHSGLIRCTTCRVVTRGQGSDGTRRLPDGQRGPARVAMPCAPCLPQDDLTCDKVRAHSHVGAFS